MGFETSATNVRELPESFDRMIRLHRHELRRLVRCQPVARCFAHESRAWEQCEWCWTLHQATLQQLNRRFEKRFADRRGPQNPIGWLTSVTSRSVLDAVRSIRSEMNIGARPERHPKWLIELTGDNGRHLAMIEQLRWWAGPQHVPDEATIIPFRYLAARLDEPDTAEFRAEVEGLLQDIAAVQFGWFARNLGEALQARAAERAIYCRVA